MTCGVYKITNLITNKNYIGVSIHIEQRWKEHKTGKGSKLLYQDFLKYGLINFSFEIIEECSEEKIYEREVYWISYYNSYLDGYNQNPGGKDNNLQAIEATKKQIHCYDLNGKYICTYESIAEAERITKIPNSNISKAAKQSDRMIAGPYQWRYEKVDKLPPYKRTIRKTEKNNNKNGKKVNQYDKNLNLIATYSSISEAARQTNIAKSSIGMACHGQRKTAGNYIWKFV